MENKEYRTVDKSQWPRGAWDNEPDKVQFQDEATGLPCLIVRGPSGALCGYVGVSEGHRLFGVDYDAARREVSDEDDSNWLDVHGGLTFSDFCAESTDEAHHICHVPSPGEPDRVWWLGFDCAHACDLCPAYAGYGNSFMPGGYEVYRDLAYVKSQVRGLAEQIGAIKGVKS